MSIAKFVAEKVQQEGLKTEAITLRLPFDIAGQVDELASSLNTTRQEILQEFVTAGLHEAQKEFMRLNQLSVSAKTDDREPVSVGSRFFVLNTNKNNNLSDHVYMLDNGFAAAFYDPWKYKIDKLQSGDTVFLYESGVGIVAVGSATGEVEVDVHENDDGSMDADETHQQKLNNYRRVNPLSAKEIKKLVGQNLVYLQTMFEVSNEVGSKILSKLA